MVAPIGHVGNRVSALVDGQLPAELADRLWAHVHSCCLCRDQVEREGWVKTRVAGLSHQCRPAPDYLQSLLTLSPTSTRCPPRPTGTSRRGPRGVVRRWRCLVGAGSVSAALVGVVALAGPAQAPVPAERQAPFASFPRPDSVRCSPAATAPVARSAPP
ncbi:hypothetical protein [Nocardioides alcanivorans]|uniref:hypothetical protein n=1 Tax=Nocardioides alcanivorans TaxID=2897352 RepID=UPI001F18AF39|nr:hypothetical protein [Nocardioides alcanivorans]